MSGFGMTELLVILAIVLLIFGPKRLKTLGSDLGNAIKGFRTAVTDEDKAVDNAQAEKVIEGEVNAPDTDGASQPEQTESKQNTNV
ncbi:MAG: twin-arginine translocase TatA/TatE family subunit [Pseudomonadales bacterium]|jgi:sec-independent protein translocase protein TatA|nr:twin-arginine translocase TatA/TatE family subunit [Pseudomonadales bacterium]MDP6471784.1 twin-arginine translocase TatA/TatE family subunit [Pseudomonadales bacterium]MDP6828802.1 twin-arginine translocase TatA/TatE family subunit [Pseudomonadales bacterium]|tara:strand:- start:1434 stop:1691 length:258 start_codon:yes stop_codon:yes gene_type:complete